MNSNREGKEHVQLRFEILASQTRNRTCPLNVRMRCVFRGVEEAMKLVDNTEEVEEVELSRSFSLTLGNNNSEGQRTRVCRSQ